MHCLNMLLNFLEDLPIRCHTRKSIIEALLALYECLQELSDSITNASNKGKSDTNIKKLDV